MNDLFNRNDIPQIRRNNLKLHIIDLNSAMAILFNSVIFLLIFNASFVMTDYPKSYFCPDNWIQSSTGKYEKFNEVLKST